MSERDQLGAASRPRALSRGEIAVALLIGAASFLLAAIRLAPYPELLGNDQLGRVRWVWEFFKPAVPLAAGAGACLVTILLAQRWQRT
jgi:hypothetical protein